MLKKGMCFSKILVLLLGCASLCACADRIRSNVDALAQPDAQQMKRYVLLPGNQDILPNDLQFIEFSNYLDKILAAKGFSKSLDFSNTDVAVFLSYGVGNPQEHQYTYNLPVWGQTGIASSYTNGTISTFGATSTYSGTTSYTPTYGVTGYSTHSGSYVTFGRYVALNAYDVPAYLQSKTAREVWRTSAISVGASNDLRAVFPHMLVALEPYIATNSNQRVVVDVAKDGPEVLSLKGTGSTNEGEASASQDNRSASGFALKQKR